MPLDGFGFIVSGAKNKSSIKINDIETPIPGLSTEIINSTLYYEKYGFSARVSNRYRDDFIGEVPQFDATLTLNNVSAESLLDAQIGYAIPGRCAGRAELQPVGHQSHRRAVRAEQRRYRLRTT